MESSQNVNPNIVRLKVRADDLLQLQPCLLVTATSGTPLTDASLQVLDCLSRAWEMRWRRALPSQDVHGAGRLSLEQAVAGPFVPSDDEVAQIPFIIRRACPNMKCCADFLIFTGCRFWVWQVGKLEQACQENLKQLRMHYNLAEHMAAFFKTLYGVVSRRDRVPRHLLEFARLSRKVWLMKMAKETMRKPCAV